MKRLLLTGVVASVAWGGSASGQSARPAAAGSPPAPAATDGRPGDGVIVMKTAGQPDRRVQVIRSERTPDGKVLTEVKDLATGHVYTLTDDAPGGQLDAPVAAPPPAPKPVAPRPAGRVFGPKDTPRTAIPAEPKPGIFTRIFGGKPTPPPQPPRQPAPPVRSAIMPGRTPAPAPLPPAPAVVPANGPVQAGLTESAASDDQMARELAQYVQDLQTHARPSFRMEAATGLADGRYASRDEVKQALAAAAKDDPAGVVRGHCIDCLSRLGYADPEYVRRLGLWANDPEPSVQRAAKEAVEKLTPR